MNNLKLYEEWFGKKLKDIEKVQEEPTIPQEKIDEIINLYNKHWNSFNFYVDAFNSCDKKNDKLYYKKKVYVNYINALKLLYRLSKVLDWLPAGFLEKNFEKLIKFYKVHKIFNDTENRDNLNIFFDATFYLNRISRNFNGKSDRFHYTKNVERGFYDEYVFKDRIEEDKIKEKHKDIDPLGEENWDES